MVDHSCCNPPSSILYAARIAACRITHEAPESARKGSLVGNTLFWPEKAPLQIVESKFLVDSLVVLNADEVRLQIVQAVSVVQEAGEVAGGNC